MNGLKYGEDISKYVQGAEGIQLYPLQVRYNDFTPLASVLSTTVAQSDTVSPQESTSLAETPHQENDTHLQKPQTCWHIVFTAKAFDVAYK